MHLKQFDFEIKILIVIYMVLTEFNNPKLKKIKQTNQNTLIKTFWNLMRHISIDIKKTKNPNKSKTDRVGELFLFYSSFLYVLIWIPNTYLMVSKKILRLFLDFNICKSNYKKLISDESYGQTTKSTYHETQYQ